MKREPVDSEAMRSVGYDRRRHVLEIEFERGAVYRYLGVPAAVHDALRDAESLGAYFSEHIRDAGYLIERVDDGSAQMGGDATGARAAGDTDRSSGQFLADARRAPEEARPDPDASSPRVGAQEM